jgi:hypothetical protein
MKLLNLKDKTLWDKWEDTEKNLRQVGAVIALIRNASCGEDELDHDSLETVCENLTKRIEKVKEFLENLHTSCRDQGMFGAYCPEPEKLYTGAVIRDFDLKVTDRKLLDYPKGGMFIAPPKKAGVLPLK